MTPEQEQPFELLFWVMVLGPGVLLAAVAALARRSWLLWGVGAILATLLTLLLAEKVGAMPWGDLADRGYSTPFVAAVRAASAAAVVTLVLLVFMGLTRLRPPPEPPLRQEPLSPAAVVGISGRADIGRVPPEVFDALLAAEQLDAVLEPDADGDRIRVQRRGGGALGHLPRLQGTEVAMLARKGARLKFWVTERQPGAAGEPGRVQVAYEESSRGSLVPVEAPVAATVTPLPAAAPTTVAAAPPPAEPVPVPQTPPERIVASAAPPPRAGADIASQLATLASLKSSGALSEAEFDVAKRKVLQL